MNPRFSRLPIAAALLLAAVANAMLIGCGPATPKSGTLIELSFTPPAEGGPAGRSAAGSRVMATVRSRLDGLGFTDAKLTQSGADGTGPIKLQVQLPGIYPEQDTKALQGLRRVLARNGHLDLRLVHADQDQLKKDKAPAPTGYKLLGEADDQWYVADASSGLNGEQLASAEARKTVDGKDVVALHFSPTGTKLLQDFTAANPKRSVAVVMDDEVIAVMTIAEPITNGQAAIAGVSEQQAVWTAMLLNSGELHESLAVGSPTLYGKLPDAKK